LGRLPTAPNPGELLPPGARWRAPLHDQLRPGEHRRLRAASC